MRDHDMIIPTRYSETDQMGIIHHANYLIYMEQARLAWLNQLGFSYEVMEAQGVLLPVYQVDIKYRKPLRFGDQVRVVTTLRDLPTTRVNFDYKIMNSRDQICATASIVLVFTDANSFRPIKPMPDFLEKCKLLF